MSWARVEGGVAVEIIGDVVRIDGADVPLAQRYHPDFIAALEPCPPGVAPGGLLVDGSWQAPG